MPDSIDDRHDIAALEALRQAATPPSPATPPRGNAPAAPPRTTGSVTPAMRLATPAQGRPPAPERSPAHGDSPPRGYSPTQIRSLTALTQESLPAIPERPAPPSGVGPVRERRCIACGYRLMPETEWRCPECGRSYSVEMLERWFGGEEERRLTSMLLCVRVTLVLLVLAIPAMLGMAGMILFGAELLLAAGAAGWACVWAGRGKSTQHGGLFAYGGLLLCLYLTALVLFRVVNREGLLLSPSEGFPLWVAIAALLTAAGSHDAVGFTVWAAADTRRCAILVLVATPLVVYGFGYTELMIPPLALGGVSPIGEVLTYLYPHAVSICAWLLVWWRLAALRRVLFRPRG